MKKVQFNIEKFFKELLKEKDIKNALCNSGHEKFIEPDDNDHQIFKTTGHSDIEANFQNLDKSFKCSPILEIRDTEDSYDFICQYFHLSTKKSKYSFVIVNEKYNSDFESFVLSKHQNIEEKDIKKLSIKVLENLDKGGWYCEEIILNKSYIWGTDEEYKKLISDNIIPNSLKKFFLPILENKKESFTDGDENVDDIEANFTSTIFMINEKDMKKIDNINHFINVKGAVWGRINEKENMKDWL